MSGEDTQGMGLDLFDIKMRAEREFQISIENRLLGRELLKLIDIAESAAANRGERVPRDITVAQLFGIVCNRMYWQHGGLPADAWPRFVAILVDVLGVKSEDVTPQAYLQRDLGMD